MEWIILLVTGAIIGWLAGFVMGGRYGLIGDIIIGIVGSMLGKWLFADQLGIGGAAAAGSFSLTGIAFGVLGAVVLIFLLRLIAGKR
ncbi:MAG: GlsB/YeaQ/YmgE family stress response membrane protein [Neisseria sp.]|nr:GlsB/YeaQ/YmgE family stress response membrane protein [Neisseria sp.]